MLFHQDKDKTIIKTRTDKIEETGEQQIAGNAPINENQELPGEKKSKNAGGVRNHDAEDRWNAQYSMHNGAKYRIVPTQDKIKSLVQLGDDEASWEEHLGEEAEYDVDPATIFGMTRESLADMWKGKLPGKPDGYVPAEQELKEIRETIIAEKMVAKAPDAYQKTLNENGAVTGATLKFIKEIGAWDMYRLLDVTKAFYIYNQMRDDVQRNELENVKRQEVKGISRINAQGHSYEQQKSNNCYGCAGSKIVNFLINGEDSSKRPLLDQFIVRNYVPRYLSAEECERRNPGVLDIKKSRRDVELFAGEEKTDYGNFFGISDVIFDKKENGGIGRTDIALRKSVYQLSKPGKEIVRYNLIEAIKKKLHDTIDKGQMMALLTHKHYITVVGINDNEISYLDSLNGGANEIKKQDLRTVLLGEDKTYETVELTSAEKLVPNSLESLKQEFGGLDINPETGEVIRTNKLVSYEDVAHRVGIAVTKNPEEMNRDGNGDIAKFMTESICLHRGAFMNKAQFRAWESADENQWNAQKQQEERNKQEQENKQEQKSIRKDQTDQNQQQDQQEFQIPELIQEVPIDLKKVYSERTDKLSARLDTAMRATLKASMKGHKVDKAIGLLSMRAAVLNGDDDAEGARIYRSLIDGRSQKAQELDKKRCIGAMERIFHAILSYDMNRLNGTDAFKARNFMESMDVEAISEMAGSLLTDYRAFSEDLGKTLTAEQLTAIEKRCAVFSAAKQMMEAGLKENGEALSEDELAQKQDYQDRKKLFEDKLKDSPSDNDVRQALEDIREKFAATENRRREEKAARLKVLAGTTVKHHEIKAPGERVLGEYSTTTKLRRGVTVSMREAEMKKENSPLYNKQRIAKELTTRVNDVKNDAARQRRQISFNVHMMLPESSFKAVSAFFNNNRTENILLTRSLSGMGNSLNKAGLTEEERQKNINLAMDMITEKFLEIDADGIDLSDDVSLVNNARKLEEITMKVHGYKALLEANHGYLERLRSLSGSERLVDRVLYQMDQLGFIADHYRARKLVITDSYYLSHYNDEIGLKAGENDNREQKTLAGNLELVRETGESLKSIMKQLRQRKVPVSGKWYTSAADAILNDREQQHKTRAYADGRLDVSLCTADSMKRLVKDMEDFRRNHPDVRPDHVRDDWQNFQRMISRYSPEFRQFWENYHNMGSTASIKAYADEQYPGLTDSLLAMAENKSDESRLHSFSRYISFKDQAGGEEYAYGSSIMREITTFSHMAESQMMSSEEVMELFEGLNVGNHKDIDMTDPVQAERAKDRYLRSVAKLFRMITEEQMRIERTYGMLPAQIPPLALTLAAGAGMKAIMARNLLCNMSADLIGKTETTVDGRKMNLLDALVTKGYLTADFARKARKKSNLQSGLSMLSNNSILKNAEYLTAEKDELENFVFETADKETCDTVNASRDKTIGPELTPRKEMLLWLEFKNAVAKSSRPRQFTELLDSNIRAMRKKDQYNSQMVQLQKFALELESVDTDGHSEKYRIFHQKLAVLRKHLSDVAAKHTEDGLNLDPKSMLIIRRDYDAVIKATKDYLRGKNRQHSNLLYRRRYDIAAEMIEVMEKDFRILSEKDAHVSHNLGEALTESREAQANLDKKDVEVVAGGMNQRTVFTMTINGEPKKMLFTERTILNSRLKDVNPYQDFAAGTDKWKAFPQLASLAALQNGRKCIESFFNSSLRYYLDQIRLGKIKDEDKSKWETAFDKKFSQFLIKLWKEQKVRMNQLDPKAFPLDDTRSIAAVYNGMSEADKNNIRAHLTEIALGWYKDIRRIEVHAEAGIPVGSNLDKRNIAMSIMSRCLGTESCIAYSTLGNVNIKEEGKQKKDNGGTIQEFIDGYNYMQVVSGFKDGTIIADNEAELLEQLSMIQITDYICGNVDRHMGNVLFRMEDTGKKHPETGRPILRIKQIVGVDNDMSMGILDGDKLTHQLRRMSIPENMNLISRELANKIIDLKKDVVFLLLGPVVTEYEKESMWTRVEHMQQAIMDAQTKGKKRGLTIVEKGGFAGYTLKDLCSANTEEENLYRMVGNTTSDFGKRIIKANKEDVPHRLVTDEIRIDVRAGDTYSVIDGKECSVLDGCELYDLNLHQSRRSFIKLLSDPKEVADIYDTLSGAAKEFNKSVGQIFGNVSTNPSYGMKMAVNERMDLFSNAYARSHGVNSILDVFYIDGKRASNVVPMMDETVEAILRTPATLRKVLGLEANADVKDVKVSEDQKEAVRDMLRKAYLMSHIAAGVSQVSIANYQKDKDGRDELVITDLNVVIKARRNRPLYGNHHAPEQDNSDDIVKSRKSREKRFAAIRADVNKRLTGEVKVKQNQQEQKEKQVQKQAEKKNQQKQPPADKAIQSDKTIDRIIGKLGYNYINCVLNGSNYSQVRKVIANKKNLWEENKKNVSMVKEWIKADVERNISTEDILNEINRMKGILNERIKAVEDKGAETVQKELWDEADKKYKAALDTWEKNKEGKKPEMLPKVTVNGINILLDRRRSLLSHLNKVYDAIRDNKISPDVAKIWIDVALMERTDVGGMLYEKLVDQEATEGQNKHDYARQADEGILRMYGEAGKNNEFMAFKETEGFMIYLQGSSNTIYTDKDHQEEVRVKKSEQKSSYYVSSGTVEGLMLGNKNDFIHVEGKNADPQAHTRAYISAKPKFKGLAVELFCATLKELQMENEVHFKISTNVKVPRPDDFTVYFGRNMTMEQVDQVLKAYSEKCKGYVSEHGNEAIMESDDKIMQSGKKFDSGITLAPEPDAPNAMGFDFDTKGTYINKKYSVKAKLKPHSFNTFVTDTLCRSAVLAHLRLNKKGNINLKDKMTLEETKKIFREFCILSGIDPESMLIIPDEKEKNHI